MNNKSPMLWFALACLSGLLITSGCSGYKLGSNLLLGITSINIPVLLIDT